jgi:uncharacterized membrane protein
MIKMMEFLRNISRRTTHPARWIIAMAVLALLSLTVCIALFFYMVNSTLADYTWGDVSYYNQLAYNFTHGRPLQDSLYCQSARGVLNNPFPYLHSFSIHVNFTPYLFLWPYKFMPTVNGLYLITILFNVIGFLGIGWLIARRISSNKDRFISYALVCAVFFGALPFIDVIIYKGHFPLFAGPLILAAYYFCRRDNRLLLAVTGLLLCGISEDMAVFMLSFSVYLFIFEKHIRKTALWMGLGSAAYLALALLVIQPAARYGLTIEHTSNLAARLHALFSGMPFHPGGWGDIKVFFKALVVALPVIGLFSGFRNEIEWKKFLGLIFIAPASHWFIVITQGGGHHIIPIMTCAFLALLLFTAKLELRPVAAVRTVTAMLIFIFYMPLLPSVYYMVKHLPYYTDAKSIARMETNKSVLREIAALPNEAGISYWTNQGIDAFITSRNNVWRFPAYFDSADYLVIQKDADQTFFHAQAETSGSIETAIAEGKYYTTGAEIIIPDEMVKRIERELVMVKTSHEVKVDTEHVLILKRKESAGLPCPESTLGLGWIKHIGSRKK